MKSKIIITLGFIITTISSMLIIKDKYNGFLVRNNDLNTLETTLLSIIDLPREQIEEIKNNALTTANELFMPDKYIEQFNTFLNKCK